MTKERNLECLFIAYYKSIFNENITKYISGTLSIYMSCIQKDDAVELTSYFRTKGIQNIKGQKCKQLFS